MRPAEDAESAVAFSSGSGKRPSSAKVAVVGGKGRRKSLLITATATLIALLAIGFAFYKASTASRGLNVQNMTITKLTESGKATEVAISPEGRYVVYALREGEKQSLWVRQVATRSDVQVLAPDDVVFGGLTFSPDGDYIYFVRADKNNATIRYLYMMPTLGGAPRELIVDIDSPVSFSPDGQRFVFTRGDPDNHVVGLWVAGADGTGQQLVAKQAGKDADPGFEPGATWSPDGKTIAFPARYRKADVHSVLELISVSDGTVRELYSQPGDIGRPLWLTDGSALLVPLQDPAQQRTQIWSVSYSKGVATRLTNDLADYFYHIDITHDGRTIAALVTSRHSNIWTAPAGHDDSARQISSGEESLGGVAAGPASKVLVRSNNGDIWTMNSDGSQKALLIPNARNLRSLSACGNRYIVFNSSRSGKIELLRADRDGSNVLPLVKAPVALAACSLDGKFVFYDTMYGPAIWRMSVEGGEPTAISQGPSAFNVELALSPDGKLVAFKSPIWSPAPLFKTSVVPAGGGAAIRTFVTPGGAQGLRWSSDGKGLQYLLTRGGATNIWEQPLAGGEPHQVTHFASGLIFDFDWSRDGKQLLLSRGDLSSDVILLSNFR